jgi:hypothetical protein
LASNYPGYVYLEGEYKQKSGVVYYEIKIRVGGAKGTKYELKFNGNGGLIYSKKD